LAWCGDDFKSSSCNLSYGSTFIQYLPYPQQVKKALQHNVAWHHLPNSTGSIAKVEINLPELLQGGLQIIFRRFDLW